MRTFTYRDAVEYISGIPKFTKKNEPANTVELLRRLGHPERQLRVVHVAGTNGKGSVCAFLESVFRNAGCRTGMFTSPHLVRINERFQVNRKPVSDADFLEAFRHVMAAAEEMEKDGYAHPTYFETLFAVGMWYFSRQKIDLLLCETGLGGRLDATNTIEKPILSVITSISMDHTEYLGDTIPEIAGEKAGIIKRGIPVVYDASCAQAAEVIRERARLMDSPSEYRSPAMTVITGRTQKSVIFSLERPPFGGIPVTVPFAADYQAANASLAMIAADVIRQRETGLMQEHPVSIRQITEGIARTRWSGRMEEILPDVILDGAHNEDGIRQFLKTAERISQSRKVSLLFSAVADKNWKEMIRSLCRSIPLQSVTAASVGGKRGIGADELAREFELHTDCPVYARQDAKEAFRLARSVQGDSVLLCCGSLYLAGEIEAEVYGDAQL